MRTGASKRMELPECDSACPSCLAQQPSQRHRDGGEWATALYRICSGGKGAAEGPWDLHGGHGQQPAPESQEENHQHRLSRFDPSESRGLADLVFRISVSKSRPLPSPATPPRATGPESARHDAGGIDQPGPVQVGGVD